MPSRRSLRIGCTTTVTPFASAAACKGDECIKQKRRTFDRAGRTLVVDQEFSTAKQRSTGAGVWECGELLSAKLAAEPGLCKGKTVLELGAGCGLVAMTAALCGATRVVASDGDEGSCAHLEDILAANGLREKVTVPPPLRWEAASAASAKALGVFRCGARRRRHLQSCQRRRSGECACGPRLAFYRKFSSRKRRQPADDATIKRLGEFFSITTLATGGSTAEPVSTLELRKTTARLDLDLAAASAANCADGRVRRNGACWLARRSVGGLSGGAARGRRCFGAERRGERFDSDALVQPSVDQGRSEFSGVANLYYPDWMAGTWDVEQTLTRAEAPLGPQIHRRAARRPRDRPKEPRRAAVSASASRSKEIKFRGAANPTHWLISTQAETKARSKRSSALWRIVCIILGRGWMPLLDAPWSRRSNTRKRAATTGGNVVLGGSADDPLITTVTYYKGPAAQKVFSVARTSEAAGDDLWRGSEATRSAQHLRVNEPERRATHHDGLGDPHGAPEDDRRRGRRSLAPRRLHEPARPAVLRRARKAVIDDADYDAAV